MKKFRLSGKMVVWLITAALSALCSVVIWAFAEKKAASLDDQMMAKRWSDRKNVAQISVFFPDSCNVSQTTIMGFEHTLDNALMAASITVDPDKESARLWVDAYSVTGQIQLSSEKKDIKAQAVGVGGDFFLFHPFRLVCGAYFSGNDINKDYCVLDEDAAWQLFGSSNVAGKTIFAGDRPLVVTGVVEKPKGRMAKAAGVGNTLVFVSYETLNGGASTDETEEHMNIGHYEIMMPNPVSTFAMQKVKECMAIEDTEADYVQNTGRYQFTKLLTLLSQYGTRSMNGKAIIYPFWENVARGYEDILMLFALLRVLLWIYALVVFVSVFWIWWKHKGWTFGSVYSRLKDRLERLQERQYAKRQQRKQQKRQGIHTELDQGSREE